jgi:hypothetical protein
MSALKDGINYVELHARDGEVVECTMYRRRHVFQTEGGLYWIIKKIAGIDHFTTLIDVADAIDRTPDKYPPVPKF